VPVGDDRCSRYVALPPIGVIVAFVRAPIGSELLPRDSINTASASSCLAELAASLHWKIDRGWSPPNNQSPYRAAQDNRSRRELRIENRRMRPEKSAISVVGRRRDEIRGMRIPQKRRHAPRNERLFTFRLMK
jgi:hypothetical protein